MPSGYDGEDFVGIDEELIEPSGPAARFWSTHLDNAIASNIQNLGELGDAVTWAPITNHGGDYDEKLQLRPYASFARTDFLVLPWYYPQDSSEIEVGLIARVADETGDDSTVRLYVERWNAALTQQLAQQQPALANTEGATPQFQDFVVTLPFARTQEADAVGALVLGLVSSKSASAIATTLGGGELFRAAILRADDANFYEDTTDPRPNSGGFDTQASFLTGGGVELDHISYPNNETSAGGADLTGQLMGILGPGVPVSNQIQRFGLSCLQLKGLDIWQRYEDTTRPAAQVYAALKPLLGEVVVTHALRLDAIYTRPRPLWVGPVGYLPNPEAPEWPTGYHYRFSRVYGDDGADQELLSASLWVDSPSPRLLVLAYVAGLHLWPVPGPEGSDARSLTPQIEWEHVLTVRQLEDGDASWAAAAARGTSTTLRTHAHHAHDQASLLAMSEAATRYPATGGAGGGPGEGYAYKEGQISPKLDYGRLELVALVVDLAGYDHNTDRPLRLDWTVRTQTPADEDWGDVPNTSIDGSSVQARDLDTLALVVVGCTIWELPQ